MKRLITLVLTGLVFTSFFSSCISTKKLTYLQDSDEPLELDSLGYQKLRRTYYRIQENDLLSIQIRPIDKQTAEYFNFSQNTQNQNIGNGAQSNANIYFNGYSVDKEGYIHMPVFGRLFVAGLTIAELDNLIQNKLKEYFSEDKVFVKVQLAGIRFSVIGEANNGQYILYQNEANVFEAMAVAGGIHMVGNRYEVQIIRQFPEGVKYFEVDLTHKSVVSDPRYFIQPNDIINIKPLKQKSWGIGETGFQTYAALLTVVTSTLTLVLLFQTR